MRSRIGARYAKALLLALSSEDEIREVRQQLRDLLAILSEESFSSFLLNPAVSSYKKELMIHQALKGSPLNRRLLNFLRLVALKGRIRFLEEIAEEFEHIARARLGEQMVFVESVYPLTEAERQRLTDALKKRYKKSIILRETLNKDLIAGIRIKANGEVIDGTFKRRLEMLKREMVKKMD